MKIEQKDSANGKRDGNDEETGTNVGSALTTTDQIGIQIHRRRRSHRLRLILIASLFLAGLWIGLNPYVIRIFFFSYNEMLGEAAASMVSALLFLSSAALASFVYLQTGFILRDEELVAELTPRRKESVVANVQDAHSLNAASNPPVLQPQLQHERDGATAKGVTDYDTLVISFLEQARRDPKEALWSDLLSLARRAGKAWKTDEVIEFEFDESKRRILSELKRLDSRGTYNLILGMLISAIGLGLLAYTFFNGDAGGQGLAMRLASSDATKDQGGIKEAIGFAIAFLPRLSFVVLIEILAYFFLRMYKSTMNEKKYFQNELTNIEAKSVALRVALAVDSTIATNKSIEALLQTERNHILEKGQTTVDLERAKIEQKSVADVANKVAAVIDKLKPGK